MWFSATDQFPQLHFVNPKLWWPYTIGTPYLYKAKIHFATGSEVSDAVDRPVRNSTGHFSELTDRGHRLFKINGRKILIRGAAWAPDMFLRPMSKTVDADLTYVKRHGLEHGASRRPHRPRRIFQQNRRNWAFWSCRAGRAATPGKFGTSGRTNSTELRRASLDDQMRSSCAITPSVFVWLYGSDGPPPADVEKMYLAILRRICDWPNPSISSASETPTTVTGKSGVKMTGPYEYVPPVIGCADHASGRRVRLQHGDESGPGDSARGRASKRFIPKDHLWPIDDVWNFHAGGERFTTVNVFTDGLDEALWNARLLSMTTSAKRRP